MSDTQNQPSMPSPLVLALMQYLQQQQQPNAPTPAQLPQPPGPMTQQGVAGPSIANNPFQNGGVPGPLSLPAVPQGPMTATMMPPNMQTLPTKPFTGMPRAPGGTNAPGAMNAPGGGSPFKISSSATPQSYGGNGDYIVTPELLKMVRSALQYQASIYPPTSLDTGQ